MTWIKSTLLVRAMLGIHRNFIRPKYVVVKNEFMLLLRSRIVQAILTVPVLYGIGSAYLYFKKGSGPE